MQDKPASKRSKATGEQNVTGDSSTQDVPDSSRDHKGPDLIEHGSSVMGAATANGDAMHVEGVETAEAGKGEAQVLAGLLLVASQYDRACPLPDTTSDLLCRLQASR